MDTINYVLEDNFVAIEPDMETVKECIDIIEDRMKLTKNDNRFMVVDLGCSPKYYFNYETINELISHFYTQNILVNIEDCTFSEIPKVTVTWDNYTKAALHYIKEYLSEENNLKNPIVIKCKSVRNYFRLKKAITNSLPIINYYINTFGLFYKDRINKTIYLDFYNNDDELTITIGTDDDLNLLFEDKSTY